MQLWILFALGAALSWGLYGPALHGGQVALGGNPMRALLCVGVAYFLIGVLVPVVTLSSQGQLNGFNERLDRSDCGRCVGRRGGRLHYLRIQIGRVTDLRNAARFRRSSTRERVVFDVAASAEDFAKSVALSWICVSCCRRWFGVVLQAVVLKRQLRVSPHLKFPHEGDQE